jgi:hypothetical protein
MKIYKISQNERNGYDTYDSAIVVAENEIAAANILPSEYAKFTNNSYSTWCSSPLKVTVVLVGEAAEGIESGVILASFNAG